MRLSIPPALIAAAACVVACGGPPPPKPVAPPPERPKRVAPPPPVVKQELGDIDEGALKKTFASLDGALQACFDAGRRRVATLGGDARVYLRVGEDGRLRYAFYESTSLGDRGTEQCALSAFDATRWPVPRGGEAEVRHEFGLDPPARGNGTWEGEDLAAALERAPKVRAAIGKCRTGIDGTYRVTAHLTRAKKKKRAHVLTAGVASPNREAEARADCIVDALRKLELVGAARGTPKIEANL